MADRDAMPGFAAAVTVALLVAAPAGLGAAAVMLLSRQRPLAVYAGCAVTLVAGAVPLGLAYAFGLGVAGSVAGAVVAAAWRWRSLAWSRRAVIVAAVACLVAEPAIALTAFQASSAERYSRCAAGRAITVVEASRAAGKGYPESVHDIALADGEPGDGCYVSNGVNWLYRVDRRGGYTLGYWVDWRVARDVCLYTSSTGGWTCGPERWGPFRPGERDRPA